MADPMLFPFLDTAVRVIAVLVLCAIPALIPLPWSGHPRRRGELRSTAPRLLKTD